MKMLCVIRVMQKESLKGSVIKMEDIKFKALAKNNRTKELQWFNDVFTDGDEVVMDTKHQSLKYLYDVKAIVQYIGLKDIEDKEFYIGHIGEFPNGDRFILKMEKWLEVITEWIGEPKCEDQTRDLYRIEKAKIIGNIYENKELLD